MIQSRYLTRSDISLVEDTIDISRTAYRKSNRNLFWAFIEFGGHTISSIGLNETSHCRRFIVFSSVSVVTSALMLKHWKPLRNDGEDN